MKRLNPADMPMTNHKCECGKLLCEGNQRTTKAEEVWEDVFDNEFRVHFDNVGRPTVNSYSGWVNSDIKTFIRNLLHQQRQQLGREILEEIDKLPMPKWEVPEITNEMPDDAGVAADQMRIATVKDARTIVESKLTEE